MRIPKLFGRSLAQTSIRPARRATRLALEALEPRLALTVGASSAPTLSLGQLSDSLQADAHRDVTRYLQMQQRLQGILTDGEWVSTHRDIQVYNGGKVTAITKTDGNNYKFSLASSTQLTAVNSYTLADGDPTVHQVNWVVQVDPFSNNFILRDPATPGREAFGRFDCATDTLILKINGPAGPGAEPSSGPAWGITTNYYTHVRGNTKAGSNPSGEPILKLDRLSKAQQADANRDRASYLKAQQAWQRLLTDGQWLSTHRDINVYDGGKVTTIGKTDGNSYQFTAASPTQLNAVNSYTLAAGDPTIHQVNWVVQVDPFQDGFILRDPAEPNREARGRYDRKTDTLILTINGPSGPGAEPNSGPAWGITTNYYTHVRGNTQAGSSAAGDPILRLDRLSKAQQTDASRDRASYLKAQQRVQGILTSGEWISTHRDINVYDGGTDKTITKTDGNNYKFVLATPTQLIADNAYVLSESDPTVYHVKWVVQVNPLEGTFILRDPTTPGREAYGRIDRKTNTMVLLINGPSGPGAQPSDGPAWGVTTNYYTHIGTSV